jgi:hypothetical protein
MLQRTRSSTIGRGNTRVPIKFRAFPLWLELFVVYTRLPVCEDGTECSETSAYELQTPGNYPKESIQHLEHGESLKSRIFVIICKVRL